MDAIADLKIGVFSSIIATIIWACSAFLFHLVIGRIQQSVKAWGKRRLKKFLKYKSGDKIFIVVGTNIHKSTSNNDYNSLTVHTAKIVFNLLTEFPKIYNNKINVNLIFDFEFNESYYNEYLILIGGPAINKAVNQILVQNLLWSAPYKTSKNYSISKNRAFIDDIGEKYKISNDNNSITDYSLIAKIPNKISRHHPILVLFGIESYGTTSSIQTLLSFDEIIKNSNINWFNRRRIYKSNHIEILTQIKGLKTTYSKIAKIISFRWSLDKEIYKALKVPYEITIK